MEAGGASATRGRRGRQVVRWLAVLIGGLLVAGVLLLVVLAVTTPAPQSEPGWETLGELPDPRGEVAATVVDRTGHEQLVVAGGLEGLTAGTSRAVHQLDPAAGSWQQLPSLPEPRHHAAAAALDGDVYVAGGAPSVGDWTSQDSLWVLRDGADAWEELAALPEGRDSHRIRTLEGRLYVVGGHGASSDVLIYDPATDAWSRGAALPTPRHHLAVVVLDGELWAIGGRDEHETVLDDVHVFDPEADEWREGPALPFPVSAGVEGVLDGRIHLVGGEDPAVPGGATYDDHLTLDPDDGAWQQHGTAPLPVHGAGGGILDGRLVIAGGAARQGALSTLAWTGFTAAYEPSDG